MNLNIKSIKFIRCRLCDYGGYFRLIANTNIENFKFKDCQFNIGDSRMLIKALKKNFRVFSIEINDFGEIYNGDDEEVIYRSNEDRVMMLKIRAFIERNKHLENIKNVCLELILIRKYRYSIFTLIMI